MNTNAVIKNSDFKSATGFVRSEITNEIDNAGGGFLGFLRFLLKLQISRTGGGWRDWSSGEEPMGPSGAITDPLLKK